MIRQTKATHKVIARHIFSRPDQDREYKGQDKIFNIIVYCFSAILHAGNVAPWFNAFLSFVFQTGLIQMGDETLFIKPIHQELESFSGGEHKVIRQKRPSDKTSRSTQDSPKHCQVIQGEHPI